jgi:hypothetical protein
MLVENSVSDRSRAPTGCKHEMKTVLPSGASQLNQHFRGAWLWLRNANLGRKIEAMPPGLAGHSLAIG